MGSSELGSDTAKSEPNVVPLCDILLVLLIIFMVVTPMIQKGANVSLPEAKNISDQKEAGQLITVSIKRDGTVYVGDKIVEDITKLSTIIEDTMEEKQITDRKVQLRADVELDYGKIIDVMNEIKNARVELLALLVDKFAESD
ncbi:MAG: biopolymer transporter ExbD [Candidatus Aminicenantes bacterium]|nr:biopolymer transporter ExbD [Candidatus Aminicenantes bacterium]